MVGDSVLRVYDAASLGNCESLNNRFPTYSLTHSFYGPGKTLICSTTGGYSTFSFAFCVCLSTFGTNHHLSPAISVYSLPTFCLLPAPIDMLSTLVWSIIITKCSLTNTDACRTRRARKRNTQVTLNKGRST